MYITNVCICIRYFTNPLKTEDITRMCEQCVPGLSLGEGEGGATIDCVPEWAWLQVTVTSWAVVTYSDNVM